MAKHTARILKWAYFKWSHFLISFCVPRQHNLYIFFLKKEPFKFGRVTGLLEKVCDRIQISGGNIPQLWLQRLHMKIRK